MENQEISTIIDMDTDDIASIRNLIYQVRNQQVMLDSDLAMLYQVETGRLNVTVK